MATTTLTVDGDWTNAQSGAIAAVSVQATSRELIYRIDTTTPASNAMGHILNPEEGVSVELSSGENLYVRSRNGDTTQLIRTV